MPERDTDMDIVERRRNNADNRPYLRWQHGGRVLLIEQGPRLRHFKILGFDFYVVREDRRDIVSRPHERRPGGER